jgi:hypothetical protein
MAIMVRETSALGFEPADLPETDFHDRHPLRKITANMPTQQTIRAEPPG